ncbi:MAG: copper resistance protein CopC [Rhodoluna sp.]|nr:copper resistance protein CopC [Rhodoluna sp.]
MRKLSVSAIVLAISSIFILSSPAFAHNELVSQSPSGDSVVEAGSIEIRLEYAEEPIATAFGEGNLIAIANAETGEQLGPACARVDGTSMYTTVNIVEPGIYKILWRSASDDGHIASGDYLITVENNTGFETDQIGNQCFDDEGVELKVDTQEPLSQKIDQMSGFWQGLLWGVPIVVGGGVLGAFLVMRRSSNKSS